MMPNDDDYENKTLDKAINNIKKRNMSEGGDISFMVETYHEMKTVAEKNKDREKMRNFLEESQSEGEIHDNSVGNRRRGGTFDQSISNDTLRT